MRKKLELPRAVPMRVIVVGDSENEIESDPESTSASPKKLHWEILLSSLLPVPAYFIILYIVLLTQDSSLSSVDVLGFLFLHTVIAILFWIPGYVLLWCIYVKSISRAKDLYPNPESWETFLLVLVLNYGLMIAGCSLPGFFGP